MRVVSKSLTVVHVECQNVRRQVGAGCARTRKNAVFSLKRPPRRPIFMGLKGRLRKDLEPRSVAVLMEGFVTAC